MKKSFLIILVLAMALFAGDGTFSTDADWSNAPYKSGELLSFACTVDTLDTLYSAKFSLAKYDDWSFATYPPGFAWLLSSTAGKPRVSAWVQGSMDATNWFVVDTLLATDSTETITREACNLNNIKAKWYRLKVQGTAANRSDTSAKFWFYFYKEE